MPPTTAGRHRARRPAAPGAPLHAVAACSRRTPVLALVAALVTAVGVAAFGLTVGAAATADTAIVAADSMNRTVPSGFGMADVGGAYSVSAPSRTHVGDHVGVLGPIDPGHAVSATLSQSSLKSVDIRTTLRLTADATSGGGVYFSDLLRSSPDGSTYYATLRALPDGRFAVCASMRRQGGGPEVVLAKQVFVPGINASSPSIVFAAQIFGSTATTIRLSAWASDAAPANSWQLSYTRASPSGIAQAGRLGFSTYLSRKASAATSAEILRYVAWFPSTSQISSSPAPTPLGATTPPAGSPAPGTSTTLGETTPPAGSPAPSNPSSSALSQPPTTAPPVSSGSTSAAASSAGSAPPPPPPPNSRVGATLGTANYTVPSNALFVAPTGDDSTSGTEQAPWRTIGHAIAAASSNATIVLRGGTYHESVTVPGNKTLTIESYPGEIVWLDGTRAVTDWAPSGAHWIASGWTAEFDSTPSYTSTVPTGQYWAFVNPAHPMAAHPDQFWLGNTPLTQVESADKVTPGTFYVDYTQDEIVLGQDPRGLSPTASDLGVAISVNSPNTVLRGFGVRRYATAVNKIGSVRLVGDGDSIDNVVVTQSSTTGIAISKVNVHVSNVTLSDNGMLGMTAVYADGLVVDSVLSEHNNVESFNFAPVSGGTKIGRSRGVTVRDSSFQSNHGPGLWFDESCYDVTAVGDSFVGNDGNGMSFEISSTGVFANNLVVGNGAIGFKINDSNDARVWNNTFANNANNISITQDSRQASNPATLGHDPRQPNPDRTVPWLIFNDVVHNNVIQPTTSGAPSTTVIDFTGQYSAAQLHTDIDGNLYTRPQSGAPLISWDGPNKQQQQFTTCASFASAVGLGESNVDVSLAAWADPAAHQALGRPLPLPADIAAAAGLPVAVRHVGTFW